jgi:hypothetical protein
VLFAGIAKAALAASTALAAPAGTSRGPNTPTDPYVLPVGDGVSTKSLLTVSDDGAASDDYGAVPRGRGRIHHQDEESSGIVDARRFRGNGWFLFDAQVHLTNPDPDLVELGQLLAIHVREFGDVYTIDGDA